MKKIIALLLTVIMTVGLIGCGSTSKEETSSAPAETSTKSESAAPEEKSDAAEVEWPDGNISLIVSAAAGGGTDLAARTMLDALNKYGNFGVVNNTDGAGVVAWEQVKGSDPSTCAEILFFNPGMLSSYVTGLTDINPVEDLVPVWSIKSSSSFYIIVNKDSQFDSLQEVIDYCKENPGKLNFGVAMGDMEHIAAGSLMSQLGIEWNYVAAGSDADRVAQILGNNLDITICSQSQTQSYNDAGEIKVLCAVLGRSSVANEALQAAPTLEELGYENVKTENCLIAWAPVGADPAVYENIYNVLDSACFTPEVIQANADRGVEYTSLGGLENSQEHVATMLEAYSEACNVLGLAAEGR